MTETFVKFTGTNASVEKLVANLGDRVTFTAAGECVHVGREKRADGEHRPVVTFRVDDVQVGPITEAPKDEQLPFDDDEDA